MRPEFNPSATSSNPKGKPLERGRQEDEVNSTAQMQARIFLEKFYTYLDAKTPEAGYLKLTWRYKNPSNELRNLPDDAVSLIVPKLIQTLKEEIETDGLMQDEIVSALEIIGPKASLAAPMVGVWLLGCGYVCERLALDTLKAMKDDAIPVLIEALKDKETYLKCKDNALFFTRGKVCLREGAAFALGEIGVGLEVGLQVKNALENALKNEDDDNVRITITQAIKRFQHIPN